MFSSAEIHAATMSIRDPEGQFEHGVPREFVTTHWSVVLLAGEAESAEATAALEHLCRLYWYPLYACVRRQGHTAEDAQDLTQAFFARLLQKNYLQRADRERGRFRTFLLTSLKNFLHNESRKAQAGKRGGDANVLSLDEQDAEGRYLAEPTDDLAPDKLFEKRWAATLLSQVLSRLRVECADTGRDALFEAFKAHFWGNEDGVSHDAIASQLGMTTAHLGVALHRLRRRYRQLLRAEVSKTVADPGEVDEELRHLAGVMSR